MFDDLVEITSFQDYIGAHIAKSKLESEGIRCCLFNESLVTWNWFYSHAWGGVKVMVRNSVADEARAILSAEPMKLEQLDDEAFAPHELFCPECTCSNVHKERLPRRLFFLLALLWYSSLFLANLGLWAWQFIIFGISPIVFLAYLSYRWFKPTSICANCGHEWM